MEKAIIVRGRMMGPQRVELDAPVPDVEGLVEVVLRLLAAPKLPGEDIFEFPASLPPGTRSKEDTDRQIAEERADWGDR